MAQRHTRRERPKNPDLGMYTPWGVARSVTVLDQGVQAVLTPDGGGYVLTNSAARRLSEPAREHAVRYSRNYYGYGFPSGAWAILALERPDLRERMLIGHDVDEEPETYLLNTLSETHADYLLARKIDPEPTRYRRWQQRRCLEQMRAEKSPDLIVRIRGRWRTGANDVVEVTTADGLTHQVTAKSYATLDPDAPLLSRCTVRSTDQARDPLVASALATAPPIELQLNGIIRRVHSGGRMAELRKITAIAEAAVDVYELTQDQPDLADATRSVALLAVQYMTEIGQAEARRILGPEREPPRQLT